ncbi:MAG: flagellar hook-length control protein FliK [Synergistaceae bacterium]|jgi:hypothetical protein|nr:flagellar hook-length control protein FliK [Synergistaceae bacterium]
MAEIGGLHSGAGGIRPPVGDGAAVSRPGAGKPGIADGSLVDGLVTGKDGEMYSVKIGAQTLSARSTIPLFVGQRFRALWDASTSPPMLKLRYADMTVLARFSGRDQSVASALLVRGMPVSEENVSELRRIWMKNGGDPARLGALAELWARGAGMTEGNVELLVWYMGLSSEDVARIWKKIRERLRGKKFASPKELLASLLGDDDGEVRAFLGAHALAGRPARGGVDPASLLAPAWWPMSADGEPLRARVAFSHEARGERKVWRTSFDFEGRSLGPVHGDVITNEKAMSVNIRLENDAQAGRVRDSLPELRQELASAPLVLQYLGVGTSSRDEGAPDEHYGLDMEI